MATTHQPYAVWSDTDHSGAVIIVTTLCFLYWVFAGVAQQILSVAQGIAFSWADSLFTASLVAGFVQTILVLVASSHGFGKSARVIQADDLVQAQQSYYISHFFYVLTLGLVKCSAIFFVAKLTVKNLGSLRHVPGKQKFTLWGMIALVVLWTIGSMVGVGLPCQSAYPRITPEDTCVGTFDRWIGIFVGDLVTDLAIIAYAASVIWRTKTSIQRRLVWFIPFSVRLSVPLWAGLRLLTISSEKLTTDPMISLWLFSIMSQVQILFSLVAVATPALKKTMLDLVTNYGAAESHSNTGRSGSFPMKYLSRNKNNTSGEGSKQRSTPYSGPGTGSAMISRSRNDDTLKGDSDSQEGIIRQQDFEVSFYKTDSSEQERDTERGYGVAR